MLDGVFSEVQLILLGSGFGWVQQPCKDFTVSLPHGVKDEHVVFVHIVHVGFNGFVAIVVLF